MREAHAAAPCVELQDAALFDHAESVVQAVCFRVTTDGARHVVAINDASIILGNKALCSLDQLVDELVIWHGRGSISALTSARARHRSIRSSACARCSMPSRRLAAEAYCLHYIRKVPPRCANSRGRGDGAETPRAEDHNGASAWP